MIRAEVLLVAKHYGCLISYKRPGMKIYISGDGGYDGRFAEIGKKFGPVDWAIMESGQYDKAWQSVHNSAGRSSAGYTGSKSKTPASGTSF